MRPLDLVRQVFQSAGGERMSIVMHWTADPETGADRGEVNERAEMLVLRREKSAAALLEHAARCLNETMAGLPAVRSQPPSGNKKALTRLSNAKVLIVDDEIRDAFALTSALEQHGMRVLSAASGPEGIEMLKKNPDTDIILMDIMMPKQDGYQTIRLIRRLRRFANLPIIGVTAGAMKGDREKCIAAGASDYVAKPVDLEQLMSVMRMWLADQPPAAPPGLVQICTSPASMA
jgi:CheY-like chemotaxis protein